MTVLLIVQKWYVPHVATENCKCVGLTVQEGLRCPAEVIHRGVEAGDMSKSEVSFVSSPSLILKASFQCCFSLTR